jgi:hypothetical protein
MPEKSINVGDFVVATKKISNIQERSVGLVKNILKNEITVFFVGTAEIAITSIDHVVYLDVTKTGKPKEGEPYEMKICNICHLLKNNAEEFDYNQNDGKGRRTTRPSCKLCRIGIDGKNLTSEEKKRMDTIRPKDKDIFTCPICEKMTIVGVTANLVRDHNHNTGIGRAWICDSCNTGLGRFKDDIKFIEKIIKYLKQ